MEQQVIIAGFGGQGVQLIGQLLTYAGMNEGHQVSFLPSYGAEMRGGPTNCNVILSDEPIGSPIISEATAVLVLNTPSMEKFQGSVMPGGAIFINTSLIRKPCDRSDVTIYEIPANDIAGSIGNDRVANMVMLGAYLAHSKAVSPDSIMEKLKETFGERRARLLPVNQQALEAGARCVEEQRE